MLYCFEINEFPEIKKFYRVSRDTVWQITEPEHILIFIENGSCSITCDGETNICEPGTIYFIPANHAYIRKPIGDNLCTMHYIHFILPSNT
jgi:ethanolamine utilization protein EutQ (cupin superfamily)